MDARRGGWTLPCRLVSRLCPAWQPRVYVPVVGAPLNDEIILGRNVINHFILTFNGLASSVQPQAD